MNTQLVLAVGQRTDPGRVRDHNEDSLATAPLEGVAPETIARKGQLFLVADGMGGHAAGATASGIAVQQVMRAYYEDQADDPRGSLERAIRLANAAIFDQAREDPAYAGMGTTLVAAALWDSRCVIANVGDSRAYLVRAGGIRQITQDHSWVAEAVRQGTLSHEQARHHPRRNVITRSMGNRPDVEIDFFEERLLAGDTLVLCSDGLSGQVYDEEIRDLALSREPQPAAEQLVALANERGGPDNITVIIVRVVQVTAAAPATESAAWPFMALGCLGLLIGALTLALVGYWAVTGGLTPLWPIIFPPPATPTMRGAPPMNTLPPPATETATGAVPAATPVPPATPARTAAAYPLPTTTGAPPPTVTTTPAASYPGPAPAITVAPPSTALPTATPTPTMSAPPITATAPISPTTKP